MDPFPSQYYYILKVIIKTLRAYHAIGHTYLQSVSVRLKEMKIKIGTMDASLFSSSKAKGESGCYDPVKWLNTSAIDKESFPICPRDLKRDIKWFCGFQDMIKLQKPPKPDFFMKIYPPPLGGST